MKKTIIISSIVIAAIAVAVILYFMATGGQKTTKYLFTRVSRGNLESTVSCTGTLQFLHTENVTSQVAGIIQGLYADFNQKVKKGQVLASLDSTTLKLNVQDAETTLEKNRILLDQARKTYNDTKDLFDGNFKSTNELQTAKYDLQTAQLNFNSSKTALEIARLNLQYSTIRSPLNGVVIQRNVSVGDAVTANNSTTPLFIVASDIKNMQILASVDESDISKIKVGQKVYFTVQTYQDQEFEGKVFQIRLSTTTVQNVVTYTVVVNVDNKNYQLLPGMTATLDLVAESRTNVLKVPVSVFKFMPSPDAMKQSFEAGRKSMTNLTRNTKTTNGGRPQNMARPSASEMTNTGMLWTTNENGLRPVIVRKGFSDGVNVEITGKDLTEGLTVISGIETNRTSTKKNGNRSILGGGGGPGVGGPGGPPPH